MTATRRLRRLADPHLLGTALIQVVLDKLDAGGEVGRVELVRYVPAQRSKFAPFLQMKAEN